MEVPQYNGDKFLFEVRNRNIPMDQLDALKQHVIQDHKIVPGDERFSDICLDHEAAIEGGSRYVSAVVARNLA